MVLPASSLVVPPLAVNDDSDRWYSYLAEWGKKTDPVNVFLENQGVTEEKLVSGLEVLMSEHDRPLRFSPSCQCTLGMRQNTFPFNALWTTKLNLWTTVAPAGENPSSDKGKSAFCGKQQFITLVGKMSSFDCMESVELSLHQHN